MLFLLKNTVGSLLMPLPACLLIALVGLFFLWRGGRERAGKIMVTVALASLTAMSYFPVSRVLDDPLKEAFQPYGIVSGRETATTLEKDPAYVVVLAGGHEAHPDIPVTGWLTHHSLRRLMEGVRIHRQHPGSKLVLSGAGFYNRPPEAPIMAEVAAFLGVAPEDMILEAKSVDTADQARRIRPIVGDRPFVLVTSAVHMRRSLALFRKEGMDPIPAPAGPTRDGDAVITPKWLFPSVDALRDATDAMHEYLGLLWAWLRGMI